MKEKKIFGKFYLDNEKDIPVSLFKINDDELEYLIQTPNHKTGNLITNISKVCKVDTVKDENDMKIITGIIPLSINGNNEEVYIFNIGNIDIANIYNDGKIEQKVKIPAIIKTLMSQTKDYKLSVNKTIIKSYIHKKSKLKTDLHTHMNAMLPPDKLIALGIKHQIKYPLYFIKKLNLKMSVSQEKYIEKQRKEVEKTFENCGLEGKQYTRKIDDNTYINFADFILNNLKNAEENIIKIRNSLAILKDGQAVFTNLEKVYLYRYIFAKGISSENKIEVKESNLSKIPEKDVKKALIQMYEDSKNDKYKNNNILQDKLLWIGREYKSQGIEYIEISITTLTKKGLEGINFLEDVHKILPKVEEETGVAIRFLGGIRRVWLSPEEIVEATDVLKALAMSPYVVGSDIIGEEINDISEFDLIIDDLVKFAIKQDDGFVIRIHAGENDSFKDNVQKSVECIKKASDKYGKVPNFRIGHGLYGNELTSKEGKKLINQMKEMKAVLEFQLSSNIRLNNLTDLNNHPIKQYIENNVRCVQGTDGFGTYGTDTIEEQIALRNLLDLEDEHFEKMKDVENEIIEKSKSNFKQKQKRFEKFLNGRTMLEALLSLEEENFIGSKELRKKFKFSNNLDSEEVLKEKIVKLPEDKFPIVIAGGSFNSNGRETFLNEQGENILKELVEKIDNKKAYFVVGHKMQGYEKALLDISKKMNKKFEVNAIIPKKVTKEVKDTLLENEVDGVCVSIENEELGIYKSFNYEIFERRNSVVVAFDGNTPVTNLIQEAKNGKGKSKIYVNSEVNLLKEKANSLEGYVFGFDKNKSIVEKILEEHPELGTNVE